MWEAGKMNRCLFTVCHWPVVATKALEGRSIPGIISLYSEGFGFSNEPQKLN